MDNSRDESREALLLSIHPLVQATLTDDSATPTWVAQVIYNDIRGFLNAERWKPSPVEGAVASRIPMGAKC